MTFHVGQKVVCIDDDWCVVVGNPANNAGPHPVNGEVHVVSAIALVDDVEYLYLSGFPAHVSYDAMAFRPIVEKKTDISVFTALLNPSPSKVIERV